MSADTQAQESTSIRERRRAEILSTVPGWYSPAAHLIVPGLLGLAVMVAAFLAVRDPKPIELVTIPFTLLFAFGFEWRVHQRVLHRRQPLLGVLYDRHELAHHVIYTDEDMAMRSGRELRLILMPAYAVVLVFSMVAPFAFALARLTSLNAGALFLATSMLFFLAYEWLHCAYHLPAVSAIGQNRIITRLREHHRRHHQPRLMKRWNFNVTVPVFDWILGTTWTPEREAARADDRASRRRAEA